MPSTLGHYFNFFLKGCLILIAAIAFSACSSTVHDSHIPAKAQQVVTLNSRSLVFKEFDLSTVLKILGKLGEVDTTKESAELKQRVKDSGIDLISNAYIYTLQSPENGVTTVHAIVALDSEEAFKEFLKSLDKTGQFYSNQGLQMFKAQNFLVGWTSDMAFMASAKVPDFPKFEREILYSFQLPEKDNLLTQEPTFAAQLKKNFEVSFWSRVGSLAKDNSWQSYLSDEFIPNGKLTAEVTFDEGKIDLEMSLNWDASKGALVQDFLSKPLAKDLLNIGPIENPIAVLGLKLNLDLIYNLLSQAGYLRTADAYLSLVGSNCKEITECFSGDIAIILTEIYERNNPEFLVITKIKDEKNWAHFLGKLVGQAILDKEGNYFTSGFIPSDYSMIEDNGMLYLSSTEQLRNDLLEKKTEALNAQILSNAGNAAGMAYLNPSLFASQQLGLINPKTSDYCRKIKGCSLGIIEQSPGLISGNLEIQLTEQKENSLQSFLRFTQESFNSEKGNFELVQDSARVDLDLEEVLP